MKVIFRKFRKGGDIIAIFPEEPGTNNPADCLCYQHLGQHGSCDAMGIVSITVPAAETEYTPLLKELQRIGYENLRVVRRQSLKDYLKRKEALTSITKAGDSE